MGRVIRIRTQTSGTRTGGTGSLGGLLRLVLPKGSLEKATLDLFEAADLPVHPFVDGRLPGHHRRPPDRLGAHPAPAGDPDVRRRGAVRHRHHRSRLGRGDRQRRREPRRTEVLQGHQQPDQARRRRRRRQPGDVGGRPARRRPGPVGVPGADQALLRRSAASTPRSGCPTAPPRRRSPTSPTAWSRSPRPVEPCAPPA